MVFTGIRCQQVQLLNSRDPRQIIFDTGGAPAPGIRAKHGAPHVCIESWYGYDDPEWHDQQLSTKPGIQTLGIQGIFSTAYSIGPNSAWL